MHKSEIFMDWFGEKYGERVQPHQCAVKMLNPKRHSINDGIKIFYSYKQIRGNEYPERLGVRELEILDPKLYRGQLGLKGNSH
jgi:hypothetical protein